MSVCASLLHSYPQSIVSTSIGRVCRGRNNRPSFVQSLGVRACIHVGWMMSEAMQARLSTRWPKGVSGNPAGRPKGARHKYLVAMEALLDGEAESLTRKAIGLALAGDTTALRLCLERILPARKDRPVQLELPPIEGVRDLARATMVLLQAVAAGEITPAEAGEVAKLVEVHRRTVETVELEERLRRGDGRSGHPPKRARPRGADQEIHPKIC